MKVLYYSKNKMAELRSVMLPVENKECELVGGKCFVKIFLNRFALFFSEEQKARIWKRRVLISDYKDGHIETSVKIIKSAYFICAVKDGVYCDIQNEDIEPLKAMFGFSR